LKRNPPKKKKKPPPENIAYHMTLEELEESVRKHGGDHFAPKKPKPKQPVDPAGKKFFLGIMCQPKEK